MPSVSCVTWPGDLPGRLDDLGLDGAVPLLTARCSVPRDHRHRRVEPGADREVEVHAAYFCIAEALTNAAKHSGRGRRSRSGRRATVTEACVVERRPTTGGGGATVTPGGGLAGLVATGRHAWARSAMHGQCQPGRAVPTTVVPAELPMRVVIAEDLALLRRTARAAAPGQLVRQLIAAIDDPEHPGRGGAGEEQAPSMAHALDVRDLQTLHRRADPAHARPPHRWQWCRRPRRVPVRRGPRRGTAGRDGRGGVGFLLKDRIFRGRGRSSRPSRRVARGHGARPRGGGPSSSPPTRQRGPRAGSRPGSGGPRGSSPRAAPTPPIAARAASSRTARSRSTWPTSSASSAWHADRADPPARPRRGGLPALVAAPVLRQSYVGA